MIDIRSITSNMGSMINRFQNRKSTLLIGEISNEEIIKNHNEKLSIFKVGNYEQSNFKGDFKSESFWNNLFEDLIMMDYNFDLIIFNTENVKEFESIDEKLLNKISLISYNLLNDKGTIIYHKNTKLVLNNSKIKDFGSNFKIYNTNKDIDLEMTNQDIELITKQSNDDLNKIINILNQLLDLNS